MKNYRIPVIWKMRGYIKTPKNTLKDAIGYALAPDTPLPQDNEYVGGSLEIDVARLYADARDHLPNSDAEDFEDFLREKDRQKGEAE
uniref:hypothetical protein n=1 Tax=Candidatus Fimivicinus sp. TaxID=3056640 RepID=UPI004026BA09